MLMNYKMAGVFDKIRVWLWARFGIVRARMRLEGIWMSDQIIYDLTKEYDFYSLAPHLAIIAKASYSRWAEGRDAFRRFINGFSLHLLSTNVGDLT